MLASCDRGCIFHMRFVKMCWYFCCALSVFLALSEIVCTNVVCCIAFLQALRVPSIGHVCCFSLARTFAFHSVTLHTFTFTFTHTEKYIANEQQRSQAICDGRRRSHTEPPPPMHNGTSTNKKKKRRDAQCVCSHTTQFEVAWCIHTVNSSCSYLSIITIQRFALLHRHRNYRR